MPQRRERRQLTPFSRIPLQSSGVPLRPCANINAKITKYSAKPVGSAAFFLLVHYDYKAYAHNSPVEAIGFGYPEAVAEVSRRLGGATGVFDGVFVYVDTTDGRKSFKV